MSPLLKSLSYGITSVLLTLLADCSPDSKPDQAIVLPSSPSPKASVASDSAPQPVPASPAPQSSAVTAKLAAKLPVERTTVKPDPAPAESSIAIVKPTFWSKERMAGFSTDGSHFLYLESSRDTGAGIPRSRLQVVNVSANTCPQEACVATHYSEADADLPTNTAEDILLKQTWQVRQELKLTPIVAGSELPIVSRSRQPNGTEQVTVRLKSGDSLQLQLQQKRVISQRYGGTAERDRAAMQLQVSHQGQARSLDSLSNFREGILDYSIRSVKLSPDGKRLAILLTATTPTFEGTLGTTLVQGIEL